MHHKRKGPKSTRSGCLWCKPHKHQREGKGKRMTHSTRKRALRELDWRLERRQAP